MATSSTKTSGYLSTQGTATLFRDGCFCRKEFPVRSRNAAAMLHSANLANLVHIPLGGAVITGAGELPFKSIHPCGWHRHVVAFLGTVNPRFHMQCSCACAEHNFESIAFPLIGAGTGGGSADDVLSMMQDELGNCDFDGLIRIVRFRR